MPLSTRGIFESLRSQEWAVSVGLCCMPWTAVICFSRTVVRAENDHVSMKGGRKQGLLHSAAGLLGAGSQYRSSSLPSRGGQVASSADVSVSSYHPLQVGGGSFEILARLAFPWEGSGALEIRCPIPAMVTSCPLLHGHSLGDYEWYPVQRPESCRGPSCRALCQRVCKWHKVHLKSTGIT